MEHSNVDSKRGFWQRQAYMLSSLGLFYIILIALFAVPLMGTFVVILIKGALDLRYVIIVGGCLGLSALAIYTVKAVKRLWHGIRQDGFVASEEAQRRAMQGEPVEISVLNGLLKFTYGRPHSRKLLPSPHESVALLPQRVEGAEIADVVDQLQSLSELKRHGEIDEHEFNLLKARLIETSTPTYPSEQDVS